MGTLVLTQVRYAEVAAAGIVSFYCDKTFETEQEAIKTLAEDIQLAYRGSCHPKYAPYTDKGFIKHVKHMNAWDNQDPFPYSNSVWVTITMAGDLVGLIKRGHTIIVLSEDAEVKILEALGLSAE